MKLILWAFWLSCLVGWIHCKSVFNRDSADDDDNDEIVGGTQARKGEFPYQARIYTPIKGEEFLCGGTLIAPSTILTAAHCLEGFNGPPKSIDIVLNTISADGDADATRVTVTNFVMHSDYNTKTADNDIALIRIKERITNIKPVALPTDTSETYTGRTATVIGWGAIRADGPTSDVLLKLQMTVRSQAECAKREPGINDLKMCATTPGKDSCQGDSGGPLISNGVQIGVVSYSRGKCADPRYPGIYVRLTSYLDWIAETEENL